MAATHPPKAVSLDVVGTLLLPHPSTGRVCARAARRLGHNVDATALEARLAIATRSAAGSGSARDRWNELMERAFAGEVPRSALPAVQSACWESLGRPDAWRMARGAQVVLAQLGFLGLKVGAVWGVDIPMGHILAEKGLSNLLDAVMETGGRTTADRFATTARALGCEPGQLVHVGDELENDARAANAAGATGVWLSETGGASDVIRLARLTGLPELVRSRLVPNPGGRRLTRAKRNLVANLRGQPEERGRSSEREARSIDQAVEEAVRKLGLDRPIPEHAISAAWAKLLPPALSRRTAPLRIQADGKLMVQCEGATVRSEVSFLSRGLLAKVRELPGCSHIRSLGFVVA